VTSQKDIPNQEDLLFLLLNSGSSCICEYLQRRLYEAWTAHKGFRPSFLKLLFLHLKFMCIMQLDF